MNDLHREMLEKFSNLVGFVDFAFPAATSFVVKDEQRLGLTLQVTNIQAHTVKELVVPRMSEWQTYTWEDDTLTMICGFPAETWPEMLPVFLMRISAAKGNDLPLGIIAEACKKVARNEIDPTDYTVWAENYMKGGDVAAADDDD